MKKTSSMQIGKNGITETFLKNLESRFKNHETVKISVLKSFTRDKAKIREHSEKIIERLGKNYVYRVLGFTIILRKMRKNVR